MLAAISALGSLAIHMIVPALPQIAGELSVDAQTAQHVVSFYLFGLAGGQLLAGPFADRLGRRPVLLAGLTLYTASALLGAFAATTETLLTARVLQALGASAGLVTSRAMVGDLFDRSETGRRQATLMSVVLVSPAVAPALGGLIVGAAGWRAIFFLLAAAGLVGLVLLSRYLPESLQRTEGGLRSNLIADYRRLLRNTAFVRTAAAIASTSAALYMFLSAAPFLLIAEWHLSPQQAGFCFLVVAGASIVGTRLVGWFERRGNAFRQGLAIIASGAALMLLIALAGWFGPLALIGPMTIVGLGTGVAAPSGFAFVVLAEEGLAGTASSLAGALQMLGSGVAASILGLIGAPSFLLLAIGVAAISLGALLTAPGRAGTPR
jgi:DHA1 family bicyclomycin/chloramphenicol resistance-like MFS transporter